MTCFLYSFFCPMFFKLTVIKHALFFNHEIKTLFPRRNMRKVTIIGFQTYHNYFMKLIDAGLWDSSLN